MTTGKVPIKYRCNDCDYNTSRKSQYDRHLLTRKHILTTNGLPNSSLSFRCECGKDYSCRQNLRRHKQTCKYLVPSNDTPQNTIIDSSLVIELLKENQEFKGLMMEQMMEQNKQNNDFQKQILEVVKDGKVINNTNNNTTNITNNNKFNLNVFLNETCKDAVNLNDFIQSIELNVNDFINTGELGFVKGISNIMVERIRDMEPHTRPIHCTDLKREVVYVKDSDKWAKEDENKTHLRKAVRIVANKNKEQVHPWRALNPNSDILDTPECDKFFEYTKASLGGYGKEEDLKFENKIINNILKETVIDKQRIKNE